MSDNRPINKCAYDARKGSGKIFKYFKYGPSRSQKDLNYKYSKIVRNPGVKLSNTFGIPGNN